MATIDILLPGMAWGTTVGSPAFCTVALVASARPTILVQTARRDSHSWNLLLAFPTKNLARAACRKSLFVDLDDRNTHYSILFLRVAGAKTRESLKSQNRIRE